MAARPTGRRRRGLAVVVSSNIALFAGGDEADDGPGFSGGRSNASLRRRAPRQGTVSAGRPSIPPPPSFAHSVHGGSQAALNEGELGALLIGSAETLGGGS
ncbi:hypothetical protein DAI22_09g106800 [Oryza sativa Japonica Group]|nr:hypothetical protein DAI22_09g106800 [Oryza sativa Japonica Group]